MQLNLFRDIGGGTPQEAIMRSDSRLPRVLHVLLHLRDMTEPATSEVIARMLDTNPVLVRRTMAGLREHGLVTSQKGHGGGWMLAVDPAKITLLRIYEALGTPTLFAIGGADADSECQLEQAANAATRQALQSAQSSFQLALAGVTLNDLVPEGWENRTQPVQAH